MVEYEEIEISGISFRIRKKRSFGAASFLTKKKQEGTIELKDVVKAECEVFDSVSKEWVEVSDNLLDTKLDEPDGLKLLNKINKMRAKVNFPSTQPKKQKTTSG